jgi:hypothetical protein
MTQSHTAQFVRRLNKDGTIDSICRNCFVTVATAVSATLLERAERDHKCAPWLLDRWYKKCQDSEDFS